PMMTRLFTHHSDRSSANQSAGPQWRCWNASTTDRSQREITGLASVAELLALAALAGADDRVADLGGAIAVLERRAVRPDRRAVRDCVEHVPELVHERVAPADDVAGRPPELPERMLGLGDEHRREPACAAAVAEDLDLVQALHVE